MTGPAWSGVRWSAVRWSCVVVLAALWAAPAATAAPAAPDRLTADVGAACDGVGVVVDLSALGTGGVRGCAPLAPGESSSALEAVLAAGVSVEGTAQWGTAFVCRVDGRPGADEEIRLPDGSTVRESCSRTPSQQAYWSLWHADGSAGSPGDWLYATTGATDLTVGAGDVVGLVFTTGTQAATAPSLPTDLAGTGDLPVGWVDRVPSETAPSSDAPDGDAPPSDAPGDSTTGEAGAGVVPLIAVAVVLAGGAGAAVVARRRR